MRTFSVASLQLLVLLTATGCRPQPPTPPDTVILSYQDPEQRQAFQAWLTSRALAAEVRQNGTGLVEYQLSPGAATPADWQEQLQQEWGSRCRLERRPQRLYLLCGESGT